MPSLPTFEDVLAARERVRDSVFQTPLLESAVLNKATGARVLVKAECLQHTGSFKFRGAASRLSLLSPSERRRGVVAYSAGNHALGVAAVAARLGMRAGIIMPIDAPKAKVEGVRALGAHVVLYDRDNDDRETIALELVQEWGAILVPPYDDRDVICGQGTAALEIIDQTKSLGANLDILAIGCSGGGLVAGCALVFEQLSPRTQIYAVEPVGLDDTARSLEEGRRVANSPGQRTLCDALMASTPGELTFAINRQWLAGAVSVDDEAVREAMRATFHNFKLVAEPGGSAALAAVLREKFDCRSKTVGVIISGGNVDTDLFAKVLNEAEKN